MSLKQKTILVVDDDEDILKLLNKILTAAGFNVLCAPNPVEGRILLQAEAPHVILTDLHMVPENGFQFIQSIRSQKQYDSIPILVLSALNDFSSVKKSIALGVNDYVIKPLQSPMLLRKLRKALLNKDFVKWEPKENEEITVTAVLNAIIPRLGETGCQIQGPFKITTGKEIKITSNDFMEMGLEKVIIKASPLMKTYQSGGQFLNDLTFVGVSESISSKIRQFVNKRKH